MNLKNKTLRLLLGDQLNSAHSWFSKADDSIIYLMTEMRQETDYVAHHVQKVAGFFAAMRNFAKELKQAGHTVMYHDITSAQAKLTLPELILQTIRENNITRFEYQLPDEWRLDTQLKEFCKSLSIPSSHYDTEHFLSERDDLRSMFPDNRKPLMETFYRKMRVKTGVLMMPDGKTPEGGKWNYDAENRKAWKGKPAPPETHLPVNDVSMIVDEIKNADISCFGEIDARKFHWPVTRLQGLKLLDDFCKHSLAFFGMYQDAMHTSEPFLFHSRLSFALNTKMISPLEVVTHAVRAYENSNDLISLAQIEGFVRQIIGWREYVRGIYWGWMPEFGQMNFLNHQRKLPSWFWTGDTKMNCMSHAIKQSLEYAYAHHIQRLMVTGNFMLLAGIHPDEADAWYLGIYIDAIEWVEMPNTRGMSQFADGGIVGTKPYVSSANYINKMSNYCGSCYYDHKKRHGDKACPFNSLYWNFYDRHRGVFEKNPRIGMMYQLLNKMPAGERADTIEYAETLLSNLEGI